MKKAFLILAFLAVCGNAFAQVEREPIEKISDYWVYVRLEDRSGVTPLDDAGRSKAGDVVAVLPVTPQHIPSETEKKEWMIYKTSLTETQRQELLKPMEEQIGVNEFEQPIYKTIAYRKNKLDTSKLGVAVKTGLVAEKIDASKVESAEKTSIDLSRYEAKRKVYVYLQKPFLKLSRLFIPPAFAETISTINKAGEDYNTLTLWEDAVDGDLVTGTRQPTAECYDDDGALNDQVTISGSTANASYYMKITVPDSEMHNGVVDGAGFTIAPTGTGAITISISDEEYIVIEKLRILGTTSTTPAYLTVINSTNSHNLKIRRNLIIAREEDNGGYGISIGSTSTSAASACANNEIINNFIIIMGTKINTCGITMGGTSNNAHDNNLIYGNTVYARASDNGIGIKINDANNYYDNLNIKNNIVIGAKTGFIFDADAIHDYNASSDATATGDNSLNSGTASVPSTDDFVSVTSGSENLHLVSTAVEIGVGVDLSAVFTTDIDGTTRPTGAGTWDIGADEYVSAEPPARRRMMIIQ